MKKFGKTSICFRWIARIVSGLTLLVFIIFAIGEGLPKFSTLSINEMIMSICLVVSLAGVLTSWRWSLIGCLLILIGYIGFVIVDKQITILSLFLLFPIIVILYVLAWFFDRKKTEK